MINELFKSVFESTAPSVTVLDFLLCIFTALITGAVFAAAYSYKNTYTKSFLITLALLPSVVCVVVMMVSGNLGAGVAVAGAFGLVRFRSVPGSAREICAVFLAMASGIAAGMGCIGFAALFMLIISAVYVLYIRLGFGEPRDSRLKKLYRITIPENLDYSGVFDDLFREYTSESKLVAVKTSGLGSLFKLTYELTLKNSCSEKEFIDKLRCRNGNLEISSSVQTFEGERL